MAEPLVTYLDLVLATPIDASNMFVYASKLRLVMAYTMSSDNVPHARIADTVTCSGGSGWPEASVRAAPRYLEKGESVAIFLNR